MPYVATRTSTLATFELVMTIPDTVSPECTVVSLMSTDRICGGASGGNSIGVAVGVGCAEAAGAGAAVGGGVAAGEGLAVAAGAGVGRAVGRACGCGVAAGSAG